MLVFAKIFLNLFLCEFPTCGAKLKVIEKNCGLHLMATRDFTAADGRTFQAGDEWLFEGPGPGGACSKEK